MVMPNAVEKTFFGFGSGAATSAVDGVDELDEARK
jgi:hypothetical protein